MHDLVPVEHVDAEQQIINAIILYSSASLHGELNPIWEEDDVEAQVVCSRGTNFHGTTNFHDAVLADHTSEDSTNFFLLFLPPKWL